MQSSNQRLKGEQHMNNKETMGQIIAAKRKELGMTQMELAEVFGMTVDQLMQIKTESAQMEESKSVDEIVSMVLKAICLAMGVAVVVLSIIKQIDTDAAITMLGIGMACAGISLLQKK